MASDWLPESSCLSNDKADVLGALETLLSEVSIKIFVRFIVVKIESIENILSRFKTVVDFSLSLKV